MPGFGDPEARILLLGLAPAAHGGNRTGRVFTGDASGDFLWPALHRAGLADRAASRRADDGLTLTDAYIAAAVRCAPPANKPTIEERDTCAPFLARELALLTEVRVIVALGAFGWEAGLRALAAAGHEARPKPRFGHGAEAAIGPYVLLGSYHPSQQNTFTGRLTAGMFDDVLRSGDRDRQGCAADQRLTTVSSRSKTTPSSAAAASMKRSSIAIRWPRPMHSGWTVTMTRPPGACSWA